MHASARLQTLATFVVVLLLYGRRSQPDAAGVALCRSFAAANPSSLFGAPAPELACMEDKPDACALQAVADAHKHIAQLTSQLKAKSEDVAQLDSQLLSQKEEMANLAAQLEAAQTDARAAKDTVTAERENAAILEAARAAAVKARFAGSTVERLCALHGHRSRGSPAYKPARPFFRCRASSQMCRLRSRQYKYICGMRHCECCYNSTAQLPTLTLTLN